MNDTNPINGIEAAREKFRDALAGVRTSAEFQDLRNSWLGRKSGQIAGYTALLKTAAPEIKKELGRAINELRTIVETAIAEREQEFAASARPANAVDITLPGRAPQLGYRHPLSLVRDEVIEIFTRLGYQVLEGPEIEDDYHNFEALNMPGDHPARDMHDTLYLEKPLQPGAGSPEPAAGNREPGVTRPLTLLRTHTSAMQIRHMENNPPPVRLVAIGPVYRKDDLDLTHTPMFHQVEGLVVGKGITLADLKGTVSAMARALFPSIRASENAGAHSGQVPEMVRFRPSFFPYTEPSAEVDIRCFKCGGAGCALCKKSGWIEILGSGMVHPAVFEAVGYNADEVTGFAFGMGVERVAQLKWGVGDIRLFYENDLRFLEQFGI
jgi:phenylalanyl-tRNA synthetase alpha chain